MIPASRDQKWSAWHYDGNSGFTCAIRDLIKQLEALRDDTVPEADLQSELWGRQKPKRPDADGADQKPDMFTKRKVGGGRRHR